MRNVSMSVVGLLDVLGLSATARAQEGTSPIEGRWSLSFRGGRYDVNSSFSIGVETGPRFQSKPDNLPTLFGTGLESINDTGDRWSMPVLFAATLRF